MSLKLLLYVIALLVSVDFKEILCDNKIKINIGNATVDLKTYVADLQVAAASIQYTANLNAQLINDLQERLALNEVNCQCDQERENVNIKSTRSSDYQRTNSGVLHKLYMQPLKWNDARKMCKSEGAKLAVIKNQMELQILAKILTEKTNFHSETNNTKSAFIGVHSLFGKNEWVTISGEPVPYLEQNDSSSSNAENVAPNNCGALTFEAGLIATDCDSPLAYFCEIRIIW